MRGGFHSYIICFSKEHICIQPLAKARTWNKTNNGVNEIVRITQSARRHRPVPPFFRLFSTFTRPRRYIHSHLHTWARRHTSSPWYGPRRRSPIEWQVKNWWKCGGRKKKKKEKERGKKKSLFSAACLSCAGMLATFLIKAPWFWPWLLTLLLCESVFQKFSCSRDKSR